MEPPNFGPVQARSRQTNPVTGAFGEKEEEIVGKAMGEGDQSLLDFCS